MHSPGLVLDPQSQKPGRVGPRCGENRLGLRSKPVGADCPGGELGKQMMNTDPLGELGRSLLLPLQRIGQHLLSIGSDRRKAILDLTAKNIDCGDVCDADQDRAIERDEHAHKQGQFPDDRPPER